MAEGFLVKQEARGRISSLTLELKRELVRVMATRVEEVGVGEEKLQTFFLCVCFTYVLRPYFATHRSCLTIFCKCPMMKSLR